MFGIVAFALICLFVILFLKTTNPQTAAVTAAAAGCMLLAYLVLKVYPPLKELLCELEQVGVPSRLITYVLKTFGICYLTKFAADLCDDFGQTSLGSKVEFAGKVSIFILTLPLLKTILSGALSLLEDI